MRLNQRVGKLPNGALPAVGVSVAVRAISDGSTVETLLTDADGFVTLERNGHLPPYFLHIANAPGGEKFWRSDDVMTAGALSLPEIPVALRVFGDGVVRGYANELAVTLVSNGPGVSVATGAANVAGHPFVVYSSVGLSNSRPSSGTRTDRVILRLYPTGSATTPGKADVALLQGTVDAGAPALTQTATVHEVSLAQMSVPSAGVVTLTDERAFAGETLMEDGVARTDSITTTSASGEALAGLAVTLLLPRAATYDIEAELTARQTDTASLIGAWTLQATYGSYGSGNGQFIFPQQVAVSPVDGSIFIADYSNKRVQKFNSSGVYQSSITGLTHQCIGVAIDASGDIYTTENNGSIGAVRKFNSAFVQQWINGFFTPGSKHIATDGAWVWQTRGDLVQRMSASTGALSGGFGATGSGNGQFNNTQGIATDGTHLYVADAGNHRIQKFTLAGAYVSQWGSFGTGNGQFNTPAGVAVDGTGNVWVCDNPNNRLQEFTNAGVYVGQIAQTTPAGAAFASGDILWASSNTVHTFSQWDEAVLPGGYGQVAIEIDGVLSPYSGPGNRDGAFSLVETGSKAGPGSVVVRAFGKATANTMTVKGAVLSAKAVPRR